MATTRTFQDMLNEYLPNRLLAEELIRRDWYLNNVQKDNNWKGGKLIVPFTGAEASSVKFNALTAASDIAEGTEVRGYIDTQIEVWGSMIFNQRDLMEHDGKIPETTFLRILPDKVDRFMKYMKEVVSTQLISGPHFATATDDTDAATGKFVVDNVERFQLNQKCVIDDGDSNTDEAYVIAVDVNAKAVTFSDSRGGAAHDFSAYSVAQNCKFYHDGVCTNAAGSTFSTFQSLKGALLSLANGGDTNLHNVAKTSYPFLQAYNINGSGITAANILDKMFDAWVDTRRVCKGKADTFLVNYKHLGSILKLLEIQKGSYKVTKEMKASMYDFTEIEIASVTNGMALRVVALQEMPYDIIPIVDLSGMTFRTNGFFRKRKAPDGKEYYEVRNTTGYQYIIDVCLFGEMEYGAPGHNSIIHSIPDY